MNRNKFSEFITFYITNYGQFSNSNYLYSIQYFMSFSYN